MGKCEHKKIALYNHTGWPMGDDGYDGSDTQWEIYCEDCELTIAEGDGWDDPKAAYKKWLSQRLNQTVSDNGRARTLQVTPRERLIHDTL